MARSKRGLGWPWDNPKDAFDAYGPAIHNKKLTWLFNWEMWKPNGLPAGLKYVPQVRTETEAAQIDQCLSTIGANNIDHFIGFNEPDNSGQANIPVPRAVHLWKQYVLPAKNKFGFKLGSPAVTNSSTGKKWLQDFLHSLGGQDEIDFVVLHWYGLNVHDLKDYLVDMHSTFKKPIWLNEFACTTFGGQVPSEQQVEKFEQEALKFLDGTDFVEKYAWFGSAVNNGSMGGVAVVNKLANDGHLTARPNRYQPTNKSKKEETYYFFNNYWNDNGTAGPNFDHPEKPTHLQPGASTFVALPASYKGRVQRGKLIPATWVEFQLSADYDHKAWGDISLEQGYDGPAMIRATDGGGGANGFMFDILPKAPAAARQKRSDGVECIASTMGNWLGGKNQVAIEYEKGVVGQKKANYGEDIVRQANVLASCYVVDPSASLKGLHYCTTGAAGAECPPLAAITSSNELALTPKPNKHRQPTNSAARNRRGGATLRIREECERFFCETMMAVFYGERNGHSAVSGLTGVYQHHQTNSSSNGRLQHDSASDTGSSLYSVDSGYFGSFSSSTSINNNNPNAVNYRRSSTHQPTPPYDGPEEMCVDGRVNGTIEATQWMEIWDYQGANSFRAFVAEDFALNEKSLFVFFDAGVVGRDLKKSLVALIELAESPLACSQLILCVDRSIELEDAKTLTKGLQWAGFELATLDHWAGGLDVTSKEWVFMGMEV
ncbi:hypothetical protein VMCG_08168 [Cytospora schulzeri]|uniref:Asl1-like glycosyl hydrolase catalytic domain-containing protein n=1 Tax=Cytospora schulzeri TaxID=448051 RepID=A0A423VU20_9PEZI|nr:hypothetical protein VMCG_08168 [Valsa malicola]